MLSIDPGGCTGIAYLTRHGQFGTAQIEDGANGMWGYLHAVFVDSHSLTPRRVEAVICESYRQRPGALSVQEDAAHIIGALRYLCWKHDIPLIMQSPAQAKSFATNEKLKAAGWYTVGMDHARDAARHLLVFIAGPCWTAEREAYQPERQRILTALACL